MRAGPDHDAAVFGGQIVVNFQRRRRAADMVLTLPPAVAAGRSRGAMRAGPDHDAAVFGGQIMVNFQRRRRAADLVLTLPGRGCGPIARRNAAPARTTMRPYSAVRSWSISSAAGGRRTWC